MKHYSQRDPEPTCLLNIPMNFILFYPDLFNTITVELVAVAVLRLFVDHEDEVLKVETVDRGMYITWPKVCGLPLLINRFDLVFL